MTKWNIIKEWASLGREIKLEVTLAIIILALAGVIMYYEKKLNDKDIQMSSERSAHQKQILECFGDHIKYVESSEKQLKEIVLDVEKLKDST